MRNALSITLLLMVSVCCIRTVAQTNTAETQLRHEYVPSTQTLRNFYAGDLIKYDADGNLISRNDVGFWPVHGQITIAQLYVSPKKLEIEARRETLIYDPAQKKMTARKGQKVRLEIASRNGPDQLRQLKAALQRIFVGSRQELISLVPEYWKPYIDPSVSCNSGSDAVDETTTSDSETQGDGSVKKGGNVIVGHLIQRAEPGYTVAAWDADIEGTLVLKGVINQSGLLEHLCLVQPLGAGLDDVGVNAVRQWRYSSYLLNGKPIEMQTTIKLSFTKHPPL